MTHEELSTVLDKHRKWINGEDGGERAYLRDADLGGAYLGDAYLRDADLGGAYLGDADLRGAYLGGAYLRDADLRGAYLGDAYLRDAYLGGAKITESQVAELLDALGVVVQDKEQ